ncbi:DNA-binding response regulator [Phytohabitans suffuscus]|uniref:DNA-binding response regulator n=1 Tax=Phytohabitans suffuscus TaxID=624315 RepID=A0A6F8YW99_9ACTN|nr:DNA-binding response regulator [Phytohabitans suffuscus]
MIRVMVVEEQGLSRSALRAVLSNENDLEVVGEIGDPGRILRLAERERPDVVVVDVDLTAADTQDVLVLLRERLPRVALLALSGRWTADSLRRALAAGALGLAGTDATPAQFARIVRSVAAGNRVIDPAAAAAVLDPAPNPLTTREREILRAAAEGLPPKEIASRLYLAHGTVRNRMSAILRKTGARNRGEAIRRAQERGWL